MQNAHRLLGFLSLLAGLVHLYVMPEHFREYLPAGGFFLAVGVLQLGFAAAFLLRPSRGLYWSVILSTAVLLLIWGISRTVGLPMGDGWEVEPVGALDLLTRLIEIGAAILAWRCMQGALAAGRAPRT